MPGSKHRGSVPISVAKNSAQPTRKVAASYKLPMTRVAEGSNGGRRTLQLKWRNAYVADKPSLNCPCVQTRIKAQNSPFLQVTSGRRKALNFPLQEEPSSSMLDAVR